MTEASNIYRLLPHPATPPRSVDAVKVQISRTAEALWLEYSVHSAGALRLPEMPEVRERDGRADELWRSTCLELFVRSLGAEAYLEFNFAPSFQWAAYQFDGYRSGMRELPARDPEILSSIREDMPQDWYFLAVEALPALPSGPLQIGLTAVIEEIDGTKSYWSLAHPGERPDFHDARGWVLDL